MFVATSEPQVIHAKPQDSCGFQPPRTRRRLGSQKAGGVRGGIRTHGPRIHTTSAFAAAPRHAAKSVRGLDCPFTLGQSP